MARNADAPVVELGPLGLDRGATVLLKHALAGLKPGEWLGVRGSAPELGVHLGAWCRAYGHRLETANDDGVVAWLERGTAGRWHQASRAGTAATSGVTEQPPASWGLAARGALVEAGSPAFHFGLDRKEVVWADEAPRLYAMAAAAQWDPATAIPWDAAFELPPEVEAAVVQVMTYLIENENAALLMPARFIGQVHPHFREILQLLAIQIADEARHIEVFTRRATLKGLPLGLSAASGQQSLKTLLDEPDFSLGSFLLSVMGEGTFLSLLAFLDTYAPDPVTRAVARLAAQDEARHVAFGMAHLQHQMQTDPSLRGRLEAAISHRHQALSDTTGLNEEVFDAMVILAAGEWTPEAIAEGFERVQGLKADMDRGRRGRLRQLGFTPDEAQRLSAMHTKNFM